MNAVREIRYDFSPRLFNPLYWHLLYWILKPEIRYIFVYGGSSAAKTYTITQILNILALEFGHSSMVLRKFGVDIEDSVWKDFQEVRQLFKLNTVSTSVKRHIRYDTGAEVRFRGLDQSEKLKGLKGFMYVYYNELSSFEIADFRQGRKRLRGMAGQKIIADWNPISDQHWVKRDWLDKETWTDLPRFAQTSVTVAPQFTELNASHSGVQINATGNMILIKTTYLDNYWVVGRPGGGGFIDNKVLEDYEHDRKHNYNDYRIYALGEWGRMRNGGEFLKRFDESIHVKPLGYDPTGIIHVSLDNNVQPYVSNTIWQANTTAKKLKQIHEIPSKSPDNNAPRAARQLARYLNSIRYEQPVYVWGDPSAQARSTIDEDNASFFDKYIQELKKCGYLVVNKVARSAPGVAMSGAFINEILANGYEGWQIEVDVNCRESINDYCCTMEDKDGKILKKRITEKGTGRTYEEHGHLTDTKRYFICGILAAEYKKFKSRNSRLKAYSVQS